MIAFLVVLLCILSAFAAALWGLWQRVTARPPRHPRPAAPPLLPPAPADEVPLPAWLERAVNEAGEHIARKRL